MTDGADRFGAASRGLPALGHLGAVPYHISYATRDLEAAMAAFADLFDLEWVEVSEGVLPGLGPADTTDWESRRVVSRYGPVHTELAQGSPTSIWATDRLAELHHLAYWCNDLRGATAALVADGWQLELTLPGADGDPTEFAYLSHEGWPRLELVDVVRAATFVEHHDHQGAAR